MLPGFDSDRLNRWVQSRNDTLPERARGQIHYDLDTTSTTDLAPDWTRFPIARLRYSETRKEWSLYWRDRNLQFHRDAELRRSGPPGNGH